MCAINGCSWDDRALVERMNVVTHHRGPDGTRTAVLGGATLGFNRLAIIDLDIRAMQPMQSSDGRYTIVYNGEIYNYLELKKQLHSYKFKTTSDTEVLLAAFIEWGTAAFQRLDGMFAVAIWDNQEKRLVLARDPVGIKPLLYHFDGARLIFSSEAKAIIAAGVPRVLNKSAFGYYMRLMYVPKEMTMVEGVCKLKPGHMLVFSNGTIEIAPYLQPTEPSLPHSYASGQREVREVVTRAVRSQLVSDRPIGVYLSGGVDSSVVLSIAAQAHPAINTFSVGFDLGKGEEWEKFNADSVLARNTASYFGAKHHEYFLTAQDVGALFHEMVCAMDQPVGNATTLAQLFLAQKTKDIATVVLSGEGGDELFGGYERYRLALIAQRYGPLIPAWVGALLGGPYQHIHLNGVNRYVQLMSQKEADIAPLLRSELATRLSTLFEDEFSSVTDIGASLMLADERNWLVDEALLRADAMSMAASVETRVPLLGNDVRALAHALPREWKVDTRRTKKILKDAFQDVLPANVLRQPKRGWFSPGAKWLRRPEFVRITDEVFGDTYTEASSLFRLDEVRKRMRKHREMQGYYFTQLWATLVFLAWAREYKIEI